MSEASPGAGWFFASDGKWYPPGVESTFNADEAEPDVCTSKSEATVRRTTATAHLRKTIHAALGALETSGLAKIDRKSGEIRIRKLGVAKAVIRPRKTIGRAIKGATASFIRTDEADESK